MTYEVEVRTAAVHAMLGTFLDGGSTYPGGPVKVEQVDVDTLAMSHELIEQDGTKARYEVIIRIEVKRRPKPQNRV